MMHHEPLEIPPCPACGGPGHQTPRKARHLAPFECLSAACGATLYHGTVAEAERYEKRRNQLQDGG